MHPLKQAWKKGNCFWYDPSCLTEARRVHSELLRAHCVHLTGEIHLSCCYSFLSLFKYKLFILVSWKCTQFFSFFQNKVFIIIAVSVAFGFYELQAVCSQAQVGRRGPLYTQNLRPASFRKVNILQSIVYPFGCVTLHLFPCFVWQWGSLPGAQSVMKPAEKWSIDSLLHAADYFRYLLLLLLKILANIP